MHTHPTSCAHVCTLVAPGDICYRPRPAIVSADQYANQRRYGSAADDTTELLDPRHNQGSDISAAVFRLAGRNQARLELSVGYSAEISGWMTSDELRSLARRLLDAAADIEELPSAVLNSGKTAALTRVLATGATKGGAT